MPTPAEVYTEMAVRVIGLAQSPSSLRFWWSEEKYHREQYHLTQEQIDRLIAASKEHIAFLNERDGESEPKSKPARSKRRPKRVAI